METRLYRSQTNQMIAGVCGGLAHYFHVDATLVRIIFVALAFLHGVGFWMYMLLWLALPVEGAVGEWHDHLRANAREIGEKAMQIVEGVARALGATNTQAVLVIGAGLVIVGFLFLLGNLNIPGLRWLRLGTLWPLLLVGLGLALLFRRHKEG